MAGIGNSFSVGVPFQLFCNRQWTASQFIWWEILKIDQEQVQLNEASVAEFGHDYVHIRPKGSPVKNSALTSTGLCTRFYGKVTPIRPGKWPKTAKEALLCYRFPIKPSGLQKILIDAKNGAGKVHWSHVSVLEWRWFMKSGSKRPPYTQNFPVHSSDPKLSKSLMPKNFGGKIVHTHGICRTRPLCSGTSIIKESVTRLVIQF